MTEQWVYRFGRRQVDGRAEMRNLLGGKGANLAEMSSIGLPVPPGFTISTDVCSYFYGNGQTYPDALKSQAEAALKEIETEIGAKFGDAENPLLVSVRSGARASMPGMMDTVLNLGLNDVTVVGLARRANDDRFAWDCYRRFIQMYGDVVLGVDHYEFEQLLEEAKADAGVLLDTELTAADWQALVPLYKDLIMDRLGRPFPEDPQEQLWGAVDAVFGSWMNQRAITYRSLHDIPAEWGTAVNVQSMVFGNMGDDCATGVAFTRDPATGENMFYGEYLINAQGEDVVAGIRTPLHLSVAAREKDGSKALTMEEAMPAIYGELAEMRDRLERHYREMQDIEFTVQQGKLFLLQTRTGKRTAAAAVRIAVEMANNGLITREEALNRVQPEQLDQLLHPTLDENAPRTSLTRGLPASPGAAAGRIVFTADDAVALAEKGHDVILVRIETSPEDIHGMHAARGILTTRGGMTSHAAVVARGMGRVCVAGAGELIVDYKAKTLMAHGVVLGEGDLITLDGTAGDVIQGEVPTVDPVLSDDFTTLMGWADDVRTLGVRTNAETPEDVQTALSFGAEGIGLCRTEHMFFDPERIIAVRRMILAETEDGRRSALAELLPFQRKDFIDIFSIMKDLPVTIRLLDPPLHEFLPHSEQEIEEVAAVSGRDAEAVRRRAQRLHEQNPMLGHRGCRLAISYPEICEMQARAIFEAIAEMAKQGITVVPEVMVPLVATARELEIVKATIDEIAGRVREETGVALDYRVGTMIELPRAALCADEIAVDAEFFSFGTNDLTQTGYGISRDDSGTFMPEYVEMGVVEIDPFISIDIRGVGELVRIGVERGRATRPDLKIGICGEHGGDPKSVRFFAEAGLDYVSCSPYRVPIARLAAAQAAIAVSGS